MSGEARRRWALLAASLALVAVPFLLVRFPPIADLPQQAVQVRLFAEALDDPGGLYRIQWANPNTLSYAVLGAAWAVGGPLRAGWLAMLALALAWVGAVHALAWRRGRSAAAATLASVLVFNLSLYWGFYSFVIGFPVFVAWFLLTQRPRGERPGLRGGGYFALSVLLFLSHALWLAAGLVWLGLDTLRRLRRSRSSGEPELGDWGPGGLGAGEIGARIAGIVPVTAYAVWWFSRLDETGFTSPAIWIQPVWKRLTPEYLADAVFGGLRGPLEPMLLAVLLAWVAASALTHRGLGKADRALVAAALVFLVCMLVLPDKYSNTIRLNVRWTPVGLALLLLALPAPRIARRWKAVWVVGTLTLGVALTGWIWTRFESRELSGLAAALEALPEDSRVIGLELGPDSRYVEDMPFLQTFAYAQVARGGRLNFSFAEFGTSLVVYREPFVPAWTPGLEWYPRHVKRGDFLHFDYALISGLEDVHRNVTAEGLLVAVTTTGRWRLYRVSPPVGIEGPVPGAGSTQRSIPILQRP